MIPMKSLEPSAGAPSSAQRAAQDEIIEEFLEGAFFAPVGPCSYGRFDT